MPDENKYEKLRMIHQKKLGILLMDARKKANKSIQECASTLHMDPTSYASIENGNQPISLPQLEFISMYFGLPVTHFFSDSLLPSHTLFDDENEYQRAITIRSKMISTKLRMRREELGLSIDDMAQRTGMTADAMVKIETGVIPVPVTVLEQIAYVLDLRIKDLFSQKGLIGKWNLQQDFQKAYERIPVEIQQFINNPSNEPYLRLAMHLSSMSAEKLRSIAEGLLEITF